MGEKLAHVWCPVLLLLLLLSSFDVQLGTQLPGLNRFTCLSVLPAAHEHVVQYTMALAFRAACMWSAAHEHPDQGLPL